MEKAQERGVIWNFERLFSNPTPVTSEICQGIKNATHPIRKPSDIAGTFTESCLRRLRASRSTSSTGSLGNVSEQQVTEADETHHFSYPDD